MLLLQSPKLPQPAVFGAMVHAGAPSSSSSQKGAIVASTPQISNNDNVVYHDTKSGRISPNSASSNGHHHIVNHNNQTNNGINGNGNGSFNNYGMVSSSSMPLNEKAEAFAQAHRFRVDAEANAYRDAESRKVEARAHKNLVS